MTSMPSSTRDTTSGPDVSVQQTSFNLKRSCFGPLGLSLHCKQNGNFNKFEIDDVLDAPRARNAPVLAPG